jgi:hypothetical protein
VVNGVEPQRAHSLWLQLMYVDSYINNFCYEECLLMLLKPIMIFGVYLKEVREYGFRLSDLDLEYDLALILYCSNCNDGISEIIFQPSYHRY